MNVTLVAESPDAECNGLINAANAKNQTQSGKSNNQSGAEQSPADNQSNIESESANQSNTVSESVNQSEPDPVANQSEPDPVGESGGGDQLSPRHRRLRLV